MRARDADKPASAPLRLLLLAAAPAALHALWFLGRLHPDETFQVLEPALHRAFGYGVLAWEWQTGLRNWAVPGLFALLLKGAAALGLTDAWGRRAVLALPQYALHVAMLGAVWRLAARRVGADGAKWVVCLVALYGPVVWFAGRTMSEAFSTAFLVWGLERLDAHAEGAEPAPQVAALGGMLLGFAEVTRYGSAAAIVPAMVWLLLTRRFATFALATLGGGAVAAALGALDLATWGSWFHSLRAYLDFNVFSGKAAAQFGASPWHTYLAAFVIAPTSVVGVGTWARAPRNRAFLLVVPALGYLAAIAYTAHKEERFLYPTLVLLTVAGAPGFVHLVQGLFLTGRARAARGLLAAAAVSVATFFVVPTPLDVQRGAQFVLTVRAGREATGFVLVGDGLWGSGGFFYLGRQVPWFTCDSPQDPRFIGAMADPRFNRVVTRDGIALAELSAAGFQPLVTQGGFVLLGR